MIKFLSTRLAVLWLVIFLFMNSLASYGQSVPTKITWDNQVACREYDSSGIPLLDPRKGKEVEFSEDILFGECLEFCSDSKTKFVITGAGFEVVQWDVQGEGNLETENSNSNTASAVVSWGASGSAQVTFTIFYSNGLQQSGTFCVNIIPPPIARFGLFEQMGTNELFACAETPLDFINASTANGGPGIVSYEWDFGNGDYSYTESPTYTYDNSGTYTIRLTIMNECGCTASFSRKIVVEKEPGPKIECPGVVCEGAQAEYRVEDSCGGVWNVEGGTIVYQDSNSVNVIWDQVNRDTGFGYVSYKSNCGCKAATVVKVPVIINSVIIQGDDTICQGSHARYTLPQWPSTSFVWAIYPSTGAEIVYTDQRNEIIIKGLVPGAYKLEAIYKNTLLGCTGKSQTKSIIVLAKPTISGSTALCQGSVGTFTSSLTTAVNWEVRKGGSLVGSGSGVTFNYTFSSGGTYSVMAGGTGLCGSAPHVVTVTPIPSEPSSLVGTMMVCSSVPYEYSIGNPTSGTTLEWQVTNGTIQGSPFGNTVTIIFNPISSGNYTVKVRKKSDGITGCDSAWKTFTVNRMNVQGTIANLDNLTTYCPSSYTGFKLNLTNGFEPQQINWKFVPSNFGNVIGGQNTDIVQVSFNEISGSTATGTLVAVLSNCNTTYEVSKSITLFQPPNLSFPSSNSTSICAATNFTLSAQISIPLQTAQVTWEWSTGEIYTHTVNAPGGTTVINSPNMALNAAISVPTTRTVQVRVSQMNGCVGESVASYNLLVNPIPRIEVTPNTSRTICFSTGFEPIVLQANFVLGAMGANTKWHHSVIGDLGITGTTLTLTTANAETVTGDYYAVATINGTGCTATSNKIRVTVNCSSTDIDLCDGMPSQTVTIAAGSVSCNSFSFTSSHTINGGVTVDDVSWSGGSFVSLNSSNNTSATFSTTVPGTHTVSVTVTYKYMGKKCTRTKSISFTKPYEADFTHDFTCPTTGTNRNVVLNDNSSYFGTSTGITYRYKRNGTTIYTGTSPNYTNTNVPPGSYTYTLEIQRAGQPLCTKTKTIEVKGKPIATFSVSHNPNCEEVPIQLNQVENEPGYKYVWSFADTSFIGPNPKIELDALASGYLISLTVTDPFGCTATHSVNVMVEAASFGEPSIGQSGSITFCEGGSVILMVDGATGISAYQWMKGSEPIGGATSATYTATETGSYWAMLYDANGCSSSVTVGSSLSVTVKTPPTLSLVAAPSVCQGETTRIEAILSDPTAEVRWTKNGIILHNWSVTTPKVLNQNNAPGTYTYIASVRYGGITGCSTTETVVVTVFPKPATPTITATTISCEPYRVKLIASGASGGTYNWSTGETGSEITVAGGGAYGVTYTAASGCRSRVSIVVPGMPDAYLWEIPTGCVTICENKGYAYLIGPWKPVPGYNWLFNNNVVGSGSGNVQPLMVQADGTYQLEFESGGCTSVTDPLYIEFGGKWCSDTTATQGRGVATEAETFESSFVLHPNPTSSSARLDYEIQTEESVSINISLFSVLGVQLWSDHASQTNGTFVLPTEGLPAGQYLVVVYVNGQRYYEKIVIKK